MARIHRKLFPSPTTTNQTQECPDFCDPDCPYNCYTFPDLYFPPPPPPPPPSISSNQISSYLIILTSLFTIIFVLVGFYVIKAKCYADWCGSGRRRNGSGASQSDISDEEFVHGNQVDHPIWLIASVGLQQSIINSITVCRYRKREGLIEGTECSVCLNEFQEDETLRLLPKCNHAFHVTCIDTWLRSHINCPLCRAGIVSNTPEAAMSNFRSLEENSDSNSVRRNQDSRMVMEQHNDGEEAQEELSDVESALKEGPNDTEENREISCASLDETEGETVHLVKKDGECSTRCKSVRGSSIAQCLHLSPISMKRSISCNARILSTRSCRSLHWSLPY